MKKLDHIGIAVKDLQHSEKLYEQLLGINSSGHETILKEGVNVSFFEQGASPSIELLEAIDETSPIAKFIKNKGEGIHHIAFEVTDIEAEINRLTQNGFEVIAPPKLGSSNKIIAFIHPKTTNGVLIELCQPIKQ